MKQMVVLVIVCMVVLASSAVKFAFSDFHDIALTNASLSVSQIFTGQDARIEVSARNQGSVSEAFSITVYARGSPETIDVDTYEVSSLGQSDQIVVPFVWNTEGITQGNYTIVANASIVEGEFEIANNVIIAGNITILADQTSPVIDVPVQIPPKGEVPAYQFVVVRVNVLDSQTGVDMVILSWRVNNETTWQNITMNYEGLTSYASYIPGYQKDTLVSYRIIATDKAGNAEIRDHGGSYYTYSTIIPEYQSSLFLLTLILATLATAIAWRIRSGAKVSVRRG